MNNIRRFHFIKSESDIELEYSIDFDKSFVCGSPSPRLPKYHDTDYWHKIITTNDENHPLNDCHVCSYCGSLDSISVYRFLLNGGKVHLSNKDYKTFIFRDNWLHSSNGINKFYSWHSPSSVESDTWWRLFRDKEGQAVMKLREIGTINDDWET